MENQKEELLLETSGKAPVNSATMEDRLSAERIRRACEQAKSTSITTLLILLGSGVLFYPQLDFALLAGASTITAMYLLHMWQAKKFLQRPSTDKNLPKWASSFTLIAMLCGLAWGLSLAMLIMRAPAQTDLFIVVLVGGLIATAIPAVAALAMSYVVYLLAILVPAILAYTIRNMDIDPTLLILTTIYSALLLATAANYRKRLDLTNRLAIDNANLVERLNTEKELADRAWKRLTEEISERHKSKVIANKHCDMLGKMINQLPGMAYRAVNDGDWTLEYISDGCEQILGMSATELDAQGKSTLSDILINSNAGFQNNISRTTGSADTLELEYNLITASGEERQVIEHITKVQNDNGDLCAIDGFVVDVTERNRLSAEIEHLNNHDKLTGLPNRHLFEASVQNALLIDNRLHNAHNLLFIDIDQFKLVNDASGHPAGDLLLKMAASRMQSRLRRKDILARWSGDEFVIFLNNCNPDEATQIATTLCEVIESDPFQFENHSFWLTVSIGISSTKDGLCSLQELLRSAEKAAFAAKKGGKNRVHLFDRHDDILMRRSQEMQWAVEIPEAIAEGRLFVERQKIIPLDSSSDDRDWYEILLRMHDRNGEVVYPGQFLPAAEHYNLAVIIDSWVVKTILERLSNDQQIYQQLGLCFINLSGQSIGQPAFLTSIYNLLQDSSVTAERICFEITETAAVENMEQALKFMNRMKEMGCRFALDDFGSGLSSFAYLRNFPVDFLKIDGSFVREIANDPISHSIVASIKDVGHATGKKIIAEFVENDEILEKLNDMGIDYAQGFGIARPAALPEPIENLSERSA